MRKLLLFLITFLLLFVALVVLHDIFLAYKNKYKTYYFPQIETYMKVYMPFGDYGYVIFSKDSVFSFSEDSDFVRIYKSETNTATFIFNPLENKKIYVVDDEWGNVKNNQSEFVIEKINQTDTTFFKQGIVAGLKTQIIKPQYFEIFILGYLQPVYYIDYNISENPIRAKPIK